MQITYNTQNLSGAGCYERRDAGLSGFGHEVVAEMNRVGILCDLSHVGAATSRDVILASNRPVAYTHILPAALKVHPRNNSDEEIRFIADHGGFVGVTMFPPFLARGNESTVEDYARRRILPSIKLGKHRRYVRPDVLAEVERLRQAGDS